jgi:hypothetical protein
MAIKFDNNDKWVHDRQNNQKIQKKDHLNNKQYW